jgi:hypothetical protein
MFLEHLVFVLGQYFVNIMTNFPNSCIMSQSMAMQAKFTPIQGIMLVVPIQKSWQY